MKWKNYIVLASILMGIAVILGAFGAHGLKSRLSPESLDSYQTGIRYMLIHGLAILILSGIYQTSDSVNLRWPVRLFFGGIVLFTGSIIYLSTKSIHGLVAYPLMGILTPIGGLFFISGWLSLAYLAYISQANPSQKT